MVLNGLNKEELSNARSSEELKNALSDRVFELKFEVSWSTMEMKGAKFEITVFYFLAQKSVGSLAI